MKRKCPLCSSAKEVIPILYGLPDYDAILKREVGKVFLGGCVVTNHSPTHFCKKCEIKFDSSGRFYNRTTLERDSSLISDGMRRIQQRKFPGLETDSQES